MRLREALARANRLQGTLPFKVGASIVVVVAAVAIFASYYIAATAPGAVAPAGPPATGAPTEGGSSALEAGQRLLESVLSVRAEPGTVAFGVAVGAGVCLAVVWLGLGLTYLALALGAAAVAYPLSRVSGGRDLVRPLLGVVVLTASFTALMQGLRTVLAGPWPVLAVARNVLAEAVRMRISVVFIVMLIVGLSSLPDLLSENQPLRYRVQVFLQWATGGAFWTIALLVVFFSVATVAFEQRDKQIWQTMTKPVAPWEYLLGKWLGLSGLAGVLLLVSFSGVFLFTEYLRQQPAQGETAVALAAGQWSEDRMILQTQVLVARVAVQPETPIDSTSEEFQKSVEQFIENQRKSVDTFAQTEGERAKVAADLYKGLVTAYRTIEPGNYETYVFQGLARARRENRPLILRYRIDSGSNIPSDVYRLTFVFDGVAQPVREVGLGHFHTVTLVPGVVREDGTVALTVINGDYARGIANPASVTFPTGGLELSYAAGSYSMNYLRVVLVLWVKLAFLAMVGVCAATFLSFPVACCVALAVFIAAEGASFLNASLQYYDAMNTQRQIEYHRVVIRAIAVPIGRLFQIYSELRPTHRLVEGRLLPWGSVAIGTGVIVLWTVVLYGLGILIFRRRELATYSGQ